MLAAATDVFHCGAAVCEAVLRLRGAALAAALGQLARGVTASPHGIYLASAGEEGHDDGAGAGAADGAEGRGGATAHSLSHDVMVDNRYVGRYLVARSSAYDAAARVQLAGLAALTGSVLQVQLAAQRSARDVGQLDEQLRRQAQILDQIHESVLTMDHSGFITSWNKGAERLFGYSAAEAVGQNILFLYCDEDTSFPDPFLAHGGRLMEVRRRKKSGQVFWASLSLAPLRGGDGEGGGLVAYLSDITERKQAEERLHTLAYYDALTGLPNRTLLAKLLDQALTVAQRGGQCGCLLFIDLNRFKLINDTLGRSSGDELLRQVSLRFRATLREQDLIARLGGDEFAVGLFDIGQHYEASLVAHKLLAALVPPFLIGGHTLRVGASIGISVAPQDGADAETLLRHADIAMALAKRGQPGDADEQPHIAFYSQALNHGMRERMLLENGLRHALGHAQLRLHYQPKFALDGGRIIGAEALVRWLHPERGLVPPAEFIGLAEETGLIVQLGEWVLDAACQQARAWQQAGLAPFRIAINVAAREFTSGLPARVGAALARYGLAAAWLELEITESTLMHDIERVIGIMENINRLGVSLALDDFGTGYSSLSYLKRFPISTLKIDRSFTTGIPIDANDCAIASTIISIGQQLQHKVIAEGVETAEQLAFLKASGCDEVQGYLLARPLPADQFEALLRRNWAGER